MWAVPSSLGFLGHLFGLLVSELSPLEAERSEKVLVGRLYLRDGDGVGAAAQKDRTEAGSPVPGDSPLPSAPCADWKMLQNALDLLDEASQPCP